jgi:hypothetical protein
MKPIKKSTFYVRPLYLAITQLYHQSAARYQSELRFFERHGATVALLAYSLPTQ